MTRLPDPWLLCAVRINLVCALGSISRARQELLSQTCVSQGKMLSTPERVPGKIGGIRRSATFESEEVVHVHFGRRELHV